MICLPVWPSLFQEMHLVLHTGTGLQFLHHSLGTAETRVNLPQQYLRTTPHRHTYTQTHKGKTTETHIQVWTEGKWTTHTIMDRVTQINTKRCAQEGNGHTGRKEGRKSKTDIPHKQMQKDLNQVQESCEKLLKRKCRKTKQHKTRWDIGKHAVTETQTYRWTYPFNGKLG